ncbi:hypothetical protein F511_45680 [Dorcoceras hygrometricum]|uniref:Uncharacterized protein n=1 Tax=Dorcoceras hygrometricum TaxID=472368 RepID=A0A2Z6ZVL2_9LAMI|nr:hypothetical protein F511_45680 [Dorcoceras hygrometricum]
MSDLVHNPSFRSTSSESSNSMCSSWIWVVGESKLFWSDSRISDPSSSLEFSGEIRSLSRLAINTERSLPHGTRPAQTFVTHICAYLQTKL